MGRRSNIHGTRVAKAQVLIEFGTASRAYEHSASWAVCAVALRKETMAANRSTDAQRPVSRQRLLVATDKHHGNGLGRAFVLHGWQPFIAALSTGRTWAARPHGPHGCAEATALRRGSSCFPVMLFLLNAAQWCAVRWPLLDTLVCHVFWCRNDCGRGCLYMIGLLALLFDCYGPRAGQAARAGAAFCRRLGCQQRRA